MSSRLRRQTKLAKKFVTFVDIPLCFDNTGNMETNDAVMLFSALAQESRLTVFRLLVEAGPEGLCAGDISRELDIPASTLSFHLKDLSQAGLILSERHGRSISYRADYAAMTELIQFMQRDCCRRSKGKSCK